MNMPVVQTAVTVYGNQSLNALELQLQVNLIQDIMKKVMKDGTHYGVIPGTKTNSLYKPGAEKIMATFRLAADPVVEDLSQGGDVHYRVKVRILNSAGDFLGAGVGECSSMEEKYAWRSPVCDAEYDAAPEMLRRIKFKKYQGKVEQAKQVRTNPADVANTILKMAKKRALVDAVLTVTAASDIFTQDIEDLPEELVAEIVGKAPRQSVAVDTPQPSQELIDAAEAAAGNGVDAFKKYWAALPVPDRSLLSSRLDALKTTARQADDRLADEAAHADAAA